MLIVSAPQPRHLAENWSHQDQKSRGERSIVSLSRLFGH